MLATVEIRDREASPDEIASALRERAIERPERPGQLCQRRVPLPPVPLLPPAG